MKGGVKMKSLCCNVRSSSPVTGLAPGAFEMETTYIEQNRVE